MSDQMTVTVSVNGRQFTRTTEARHTLADFLRDDLSLTGTHLGCEHGVCGACTVVVDGRPARSCLMLVGQADGREVTTVEGLADGEGRLHPVQQGFHDGHSFQCGFCTPGFVMTTYAFLQENPAPTREEIREAISENLCRCTGYQSIINGVELSARLLSEGSPKADAIPDGEVTGA
jgi:carbon-monoxide dehydrogenase small subunit